MPKRPHLASSRLSALRPRGPVPPSLTALLSALRLSPSRERGGSRASTAPRSRTRLRSAILAGLLLTCAWAGLHALASHDAGAATRSSIPLSAPGPLLVPAATSSAGHAERRPGSWSSRVAHAPAVLQQEGDAGAVRSIPEASGLLTDELRSALIELGSMELDSPKALEERALAVVLPLERLEQVGLALCSGLLTEQDNELQPIERGALRGLVLGVHLHRAGPDPRGVPQGSDSEASAEGGVTRSSLLWGARVEALLERCLLAAPAWSEAQRQRFAQLATSLRSRGQCCVGPKQAPTLLRLRSKEPWLASWCDTLLACGLSTASAEEREAVTEAWLAREPAASAAGTTLRTLFESGDLRQAWSLAESLWSRFQLDPEGRAGVLGAVAATAPLSEALNWLEGRADAGDVGVGLALASRPGSEQAALERYGELLREDAAPEELQGPPDREHEPLTADSRALRRRVLVGAMTDPRLLTDLACTDPSPLVRGQAHLTAAQRARPQELSRLVAELARESDGHGDGALSSDLRAVIAVTHARRAEQLGAGEAAHAAKELAQALLASGDLAPATKAWVVGALEARN